MTPVPADFPGRLAHRRHEMGLGYAALAAKAGLNPVTVRRAEAGSDPPLSTLRVLAEALGVSVGWLAGEEPWMEAGETDGGRT